MESNFDIHKAFGDEGMLVCPLCDQRFEVCVDRRDEPCCDDKELIKDREMYVCLHCGQFDRYDIAHEYVYFYENRNNIRRKSVYQRKCHVSSVISRTRRGPQDCVPNVIRDKIIRIFDVLGRGVGSFCEGRKRMASTKFIIRKLLMEFGLPYKHVPRMKTAKARLVMGLN